MIEAEADWQWNDFYTALRLQDFSQCVHKAIIAKLGSKDSVRDEIEQIRQRLGIRYNKFTGSRIVSPTDASR